VSDKKKNIRQFLDGEERLWKELFMKRPEDHMRVNDRLLIQIQFNPIQSSLIQFKNWIVQLKIHFFFKLVSGLKKN
jgi:hypothetical protein